jgi:pyruvate dehydrogenase E2 component (dihydrolipoamide acetyltransferase)
MPTLNVIVPKDIGEAEEVMVVSWLKREGDDVQEGETLVILQAAKVSIDLPSPASGRLETILVPQGEVARSEQPLARLEVTALATVPSPGPKEAGMPPSTPAEVRASPVAKRLAREHNVDLSRVRGTGRAGRITEKDVRAFLESRTEQEEPTVPPPTREVRASPVARRMAREHDVDLSQVAGTGRGGRITEKDVRAFLEARVPVKEEPPAPPAGETIPLIGMRATIARRMYDSLQSMAQLTLHAEADVTDLVDLRERLKKQAPITYTDLIVRACALALRRHPHLNATLDGDAIRLLPHINIGVAVALQDGLIVPVIADADQKTIAELARARVLLVERARAGQLTMEEVSGGTFTVTNLGTYGIDGFTPIINPPEAAILGVGRLVDRVVIHQGKVAQRTMVTLSLTFDHRVVDGAPAAAFLQSVIQLLESPEQLAV